MLVKKEVIGKVGLFDESYFCYWDETDYCTRARKAGYKVRYIPEASIRHKAPTKEKIWDKTPTSSKSSGLNLYYTARNNFKFMRKHATKLQYTSFLICLFGYYFWFMTGLCLVYHRDFGRLASFYQGIRDGLLNSRVRTKSYTTD
jgi:GT2 family glycosyltransferase